MYVIFGFDFDIKSLFLWGLAGSLITFVGDEIVGLASAIREAIYHITTKPSTQDTQKDEKSI